MTSAAQSRPKSEETAQKILEAALDLFRRQGVDSTTMRDIATAANVATGAAYYYYPSKEAIVMDFYQRSAHEMQPKIVEALASARTLEDRLHALIGVKLSHFQPNHSVMRALLRNADPKHPLSPFSADTKSIRDVDLEWFGKILLDCGFRIPRDLAPVLPGVLWFFQMGIILFWVVDESPGQERTKRLLKLAVKIASNLIRLSGLPLIRPLRKTALELIALVTEGHE